MRSHRYGSTIMAAITCLYTLTLYAAPPPNDNFADAALIGGFPATVYGSNIDATIEPAEPLPDGYEFYARKSVWFEWTAPTSGVVQIDTFGSYWYWDAAGIELPWFNPNPAVWLGNSIDALTEVKSGGTQQSRYVTVTSGTVYRIAVYGLGNDNQDEGQIVLNITNDVSPRISGTVTDTNGLPLPGIMVRAQDPDGFSWEKGAAWTFTDATGNYSIRGLSNDAYRVRFSGEGFATEIYNNVPDRYNPYSTDLDAATVLVISNDESISNINASLAEAATIAGTVTGPGGLPLAGIDVWIYYGDDWYNRESTTDENGEYLVSDLPSDGYTVSFSAPSGDYIESRTNIVLGEGAHITNFDVTMGIASKISGTVTGADGGTTIASIVLLHHWNGSGWDQVNEYWTDSNGEFIFGGLATGTYRVEFSDYPYDDDDYVGEFFDNAVSFESATNLLLPSATTLSGIDVSLAVAAPTIMGLRIQTNSTDIMFSGVVGRAYVLQRGILQSNQWSDVGSPTNCVEGTNILTDAEVATPSFWRVRRYP